MIVQNVPFEEQSTFCDICDFKNISKKGLAVHMKRKHGNIKQLDGNRQVDSKTWEFCDLHSYIEKFTEFHIRRELELEDCKYAKQLKDHGRNIQ